jgi:hypothetical protein
MAEKPKKNQSKPNNRGGPRPNSGRKRKPTKEIKDALISALVGPVEVSADEKNGAAEYAFRLFDAVMRNEKIGMTMRLDCATEILNRVWGKPTERRENKNENIHSFDERFTAALARAYGRPDDYPGGTNGVHSPLSNGLRRDPDSG